MDQMCSHSGQPLANSFIAVILHFASFFSPKAGAQCWYKCITLYVLNEKIKWGIETFSFSFYSWMKYSLPIKRGSIISSCILPLCGLLVSISVRGVLVLGQCR